MDGVDTGWVERDVEARSEPDLHHRPVEVRTDTRADLTVLVGAHDRVHEMRKDPGAVEAHLGGRHQLHDRLIDSGQCCGDHVAAGRGSEDGRR
jgi:hypothetical protein